MKRLTTSAVISALILALVLVYTNPVFADGSLYKKGESSNDIAKIQQALKDLKLFDEVVTGYFGNVTEQAVKRFQKQNKLEPDGVVGPGTLQALFGRSSISGSASRGEVERIKVNVPYKVQEGDTIWDIAEDFNVSFESILKYNNLTENSVLQIGQKITIPNVIKTVIKVTPIETKVTTAPSTQPADNTVIIADLPDNIYIVKEGDTIASVAEDYGVTAKALAELNNLSVDSTLQPEQELKIPEAIENAPKAETAPTENKTQLTGEYLGWFDTVQYIFKNNDIAIVTDLKTEKSFKVKRLYGHNHADVEPLTKEDTAIMKSIYGSWSWDRRAIIVAIDGKTIAASMNGMPHGDEQIKDNNFKGQFCIHFKGSKTHKGNRVDPDHQAAVRAAAGIK